ncbi:MAG: NADPH-dependent F420 reductase [Candidatus Marsarchaeota archaeon]|nr:NADPH-dependent F420 reductase [Candidatus Marsarchaeota archaeon]MCL5106447.1 NADPH-dependent F420 reductase [Candidatus Marsarchaeota archaeon]
MRIAIIGTGNVGRNLGAALEKGNEVVYGSRDPKAAQDKLKGKNITGINEAAKSADVIVLAVPYPAAKEAIEKMKESIKGKILIDVCNPLGSNFEWKKDSQDSAAEEIARHAQGAKVVKAFNTIFAENMRTGKVGENKLTTFIAGDDDDAKDKVMGLARDIGMEPVDVGALKKARYIEPAGLMMIELGYAKNLGTSIGLKLVKEDKQQDAKHSE